jgi:serine/threonine-protein kinase
VTQEYGAVNSRVGKTAGGKYKLVRLLGTGGMGEVYEAQHSIIGRRFAIKFLHPFLASNAEVVTRFQREAQAAGGLENENIAAVVDAGTADDGAPYLVMEYLDGEDLAHLLVRGGPLPVTRATYIMIQACRGLVAAHARGIVHRDLKPENLFVCKRNDGSDVVKVLDFGIAKLHGASVGTGLTQTGTTMGTPFYMSLEQARGAKEVDLRTDIYALGVILYEILSGTKPHPGESYNEILYHVITHEPAPLDAIRAGLPAGLPDVVQKAMSRDPGDRYASAVDLMEALIPFAGRAVTPLRTQSVIVAISGDTMPSPVSMLVPPVAKTARLDTPGSPVATALETNDTPEDNPARSHSRTIVAGGIAAIAVLTVLFTWLALGRRQPQSPIPAPAPVTTPEAVPAIPAPAPTTPPPAAATLPTAEITPPPIEKVESPPSRPSERPPGQLQRKRSVQTVVPLVDVKAPKTAAPAEQTTESQDVPAAPRRKLVRSIDRQNPFAE